MVIKIYFEDKPVFLTDDLAPVTEFMHQPETIFIDEISTKAIHSLLKGIATPAFSKGILFHSDLKQMKKAFEKQFNIVQAAGGVVKNERDEVLFIFRRGKWDLPKGKNDDTEEAKDCALREVKEETGLAEVTAGGLICTSYHTYHEYGKHILKETHWFDMKASSQEKLSPQLEEHIEKIEWVNPLNIGEKLQNSYVLIKDVLGSAGATS